MALNASNIEVGLIHRAVVVENLTRTQIVQYAGASGDYNPLHTDEVFATQVAGDTLTAMATVTALRVESGVSVADFEVVTENQSGVAVFSGSATARLD